MSAIWQDHPGPLPTIAGKVSGIIDVQPRPGRRGSIFTVQCSVCYRTVTDLGILAVGKIHFGRDDGVGTHPYRRCDQCRAARRHPAGQDTLLDGAS